MTVFGRCRALRPACKPVAVALCAALAVCAGASSAHSTQPSHIGDVDRRSPERNIERVMSEALSPPRKRCAALNAAISQAVMDRSGSRALAPDTYASRYPGSPKPAPGLNDGQFTDKQARLEAEYSSLGCMRAPP